MKLSKLKEKPLYLLHFIFFFCNLSKYSVIDFIANETD